MNLLVIENKDNSLQSEVQVKMTMKEALLLAAFANLGAVGEEAHELLGVLVLLTPGNVEKLFDAAYATFGEDSKKMPVRDFNKALLCRGNPLEVV